MDMPKKITIDMEKLPKLIAKVNKFIVEDCKDLITCDTCCPEDSDKPKEEPEEPKDENNTAS